MRRPFRLFFSVNDRLHEELSAIARKHQAIRVHERGVAIWTTAAVLLAAAVGTAQLWPAAAAWLTPLLITALAGAGIAVFVCIVGDQLDLRDAARRIEQQHPELKSALSTAAEQTPGSDGQLHFLQRRLIEKTLAHATAELWGDAPQRQARWLGAAHLVAILAAIGFATLAWEQATPFSLRLPAMAGPRGPIAGSGIEVTPGDTEVERGSTVVIAARFNDEFPAAATLVWQRADGATGRDPMARSLSDPVFALTLPEVPADVVYHVEYDGGSTADFALTVYDLPSLVRADASLDYPDYTGLTDRTLADTRRVSAVEGTLLNYEFAVSRPVQDAILVTDDGEQIELLSRNPERTLFGLELTLEQSLRFELQLATAEGRTDPDPAEFRIEVLPNERPELKLAFPRGDQRVSPIEEIQLEGDVRDDFGITNYGLAFAIGVEDPEYLSFAPLNAEGRTVEVAFNHLLALEPRDVEVDELITWFIWADDLGPDGEERRTTSDLFFAEVRSLDEIFRENAGGGGQQGQQGGGGGPAGELIEIQRQISIAIWKLQQAGDPGPSYVEDVSVLRDSQEQARAQLAELRGQLDNPRLLGAAELADQSMNLAANELGNAADDESITPLDPAWTGAQSAYRALLKLQPRETNVAQGNGGGGGGRRSQQQLNQLRFRQDENRYATESEAQAPTSPEDRAQLNVLSRLRDLARRQQDLNERLQELQTALAAAADEAEREEIRRELKRLEEEQRRMLADLDDTRQRVDEMRAGEQREQARDQLEQTRDDMQRAGEQLSRGEVSSALAAGSRAQESLEDTGEELRQSSSSRFAEQMREARRQARELTEAQRELNEQWDDATEAPPSLEESNDRNGQLASAIDEQIERHEQLLDSIRDIAEDSEGTEPTLHRQLYDLLRDQGISGPGERLSASSELVRRGFPDEARRQQNGVGQEFEQLQRAIERAADSVLGDESTELRFAQNELSDLARELGGERPADQPGNEPGQQPGQGTPGGTDGEELASMLPNGQQPGPGAAGSGEEDPEGQGRGLRPGEGEQTAPGAGTDPSTQPGQQLAGTSPGENGTQPGMTPGQTPGGQQPGQQPGQEPGGPSGQGGGQQPGSAVAQNGEPGQQPGGQQPGGQSPGQGGGQGGGENQTPGGLGDIAEALGERTLSPGGGGGGDRRGPITGQGFGEWADRLRTVESLLEEPELRQRLAAARAQAEEMRGDFQRHGETPQWELLESGVVAPLQEASAWLKQELARREDPEVLQPIDRDPVPEKYAEAVSRYYESLAEAERRRPTDSR